MHTYVGSAGLSAPYYECDAWEAAGLECTNASFGAPSGSHYQPDEGRGHEGMMHLKAERIPCRNAWSTGNQFASYHPGIVNFLLADSSVQSLNEIVEWYVLSALATRGGGDQVDPTDL